MKKFRLPKIISCSLISSLIITACSEGPDLSGGVTEADDGVVLQSPQSLFSYEFTTDHLIENLKSSADVEVYAGENSVEIERLSEKSSFNSAGFTDGAYVELMLPSDIDFSGKTVRIVLNGKSAGGSAVNGQLAYSTSYKGNSGWYNFELSSVGERVEFEYILPDGSDPNEDYVGIIPLNGKMQLFSLSVEIQ